MLRVFFQFPDRGRVGGGPGKTGEKTRSGRNIDEAFDFLATLDGKIESEIGMQCRNGTDQMAAICGTGFVGNGEIERSLRQGFVADAA